MLNVPVVNPLSRLELHPERELCADDSCVGARTKARRSVANARPVDGSSMNSHGKPYIEPPADEIATRVDAR